MRARKPGFAPIQKTMEVSGPPATQMLVERAASGDVQAFRQLFERYADRVNRYCRARLGHPQDAEDAAQDVFLGVWRGLSSFRYQHVGSFPGWVFAIARNVVADRQRKALRRPVAQLDEEMGSPVEFEGRLLDASVLAAELGRLAEAQREVLLLRFVVGLRAREVAASIGKSEAAVMALQMRGIEQLRRRIGENP